MTTGVEHFVSFEVTLAFFPLVSCRGVNGLQGVVFESSI